GIRQLRQEILAKAANGDPAALSIVGTQDFFDLNECRDLLFHVQEHRFTLPIIARFLEKSGLRFLGFNLDRSVVTRFQALYPHSMTDLSCWDAFEQSYPMTFLGMYSFWVQKTDVQQSSVQQSSTRQHAFALHAEGKPSAALAIANQMMATAAPDTSLLNLAAACHARLGNPDQAVSCWQQAIRIKPDYAEAHSNLGNLLKELKRFKEAEASYRQALCVKPDYAEALYNLGALLNELKRFEEAEASYRQALRVKPDYAEALCNLGNLLAEQGNAGEAFQITRRLVALDSNNVEHWRLWTTYFRQASLAMAITTMDQALWEEIAHALSLSTTPVYNLLHPAYLAMERHEVFAAILEQVCADDWHDHLDYPAMAAILSGLPLLTQLMSAGHTLNPVEEKLFTRLRSAMLEVAGEWHAAEQPERTTPDSFSIALAQLCFNNDYVFSESSAERKTLESLHHAVTQAIAQGEPFPVRQIIVLAAYRPLYRLPWAPRLMEHTWSAPMRLLLASQVTNPLTELALQQQISSLQPIQNSVSQQVRDMYEESPYPRWNKALLTHARTLEQVLADVGIAVKDLILPQADPPQVLVAGCGTGQQSVEAGRTYLGAQVTAIDLSLASLAYALRQTQAIGLKNIHYLQGDILDVEHLGQKFHVIECGGVLHHMEDPWQGWQTLLKVLLPGGLMRIALYSDLARQPMTQMQEQIAQRNIPSSPEGIRQLRQEILAKAANGDPAALSIVGTQDFFDLNECRDLLFHVQEHRFTLPIIARFLEKSGLRFLGFNLDRSVVTRFQALYPQSMTDLSCWDAFEQSYPKTFIGMYSFWVQKTDVQQSSTQHSPAQPREGVGDKVSNNGIDPSNRFC
ncbi:MAG: tetratricopeptide repeat protein, partial [Magnetococcales bacterium]|nr:tetratricopeptide repeat protein [Magnetococcales bacterium]